MEQVQNCLVHAIFVQFLNDDQLAQQHASISDNSFFPLSLDLFSLCPIDAILFFLFFFQVHLNNMLFFEAALESGKVPGSAL